MCKYVSKLTAAISFALLSSGYISTSHAAGFALIENSASGQGNAYAGAAAVAEDASTVWFNPAGMMKLSGNQMVLAGHYISTAADFTDTGSTSNPALPGSTLTGTNDDGGESAFVPNFYYVSDIGNETRFGIGITAPFGLSTNYNSNWIGRYTATKSEVHAININPSFASQATDKLSIGFGLNIQYIEATLANQLDSTAICLGSLAGLGATCPVGSIGNPANAANASYDSSQSLSGDDLSYGWNFGLLYDLDKNSRLGFAYRSSIKHLLEGSVDFNLSTELATALGTLGAPYNSLFLIPTCRQLLNYPSHYPSAMQAIWVKNYRCWLILPGLAGAISRN